MSALDILTITVTTCIVVFAFGPTFVGLCEAFAELIVTSIVEWFCRVVDSWKELFKRLFK